MLSLFRRVNPSDVVLAAVVAAYLWPVWSAHHLATQDGPSHVYNALLLTELSHKSSPVARVFAVRLQPVPNWAGHAVLATMIAAGTMPATAEKALLSLYLVAVAVGCRYLLKGVAPGQEAWSALSVPLAFNFTLYMGFYNFLVGVPLILFDTGYAWRNRDRMTLTRGLVLSVLYVATYLAHLVAFGIAAVVLTVVLILGSRRRLAAVVKVGLVLAPSLALTCWYVVASDRQYSGKSSMWRLVADSDDGPLKLLSRVAASIFAPTPQYDSDVAVAAVSILGLAAFVLAAVTIRSEGRASIVAFRQAKGPFLVAAAELLSLAVLFPQNWGHHGGWFTERLAVATGLLVLACLPTPRTRQTVNCALFLSAGLALVGLAAVANTFGKGDQQVNHLLSSLREPPNGARILPLFLSSPPQDRILLREHLVDRLCLQSAVVNWDNYEAHGFCFPVRFRPHQPVPDLDRIRRRDYSQFRDDMKLVDLLYLGPYCPPELLSLITEEFPRVQSSGDITVYSRKTATTSKGSTKISASPTSRPTEVHPKEARR